MSELETKPEPLSERQSKPPVQIDHPLAIFIREAVEIPLLRGGFTLIGVGIVSLEVTILLNAGGIDAEQFLHFGSTTSLVGAGALCLYPFTRGTRTIINRFLHL